MLRVCFSLLFLFVFIGVSTEAEAAYDRCPRQTVKTELKAKRAKTRYQIGDIRSINDYLGNHSPEQNGTVLAFVQWGGPDVLNVETHFDFSLMDIGNNRACVMLDQVLVYFYAAPILVMPKNFRRHSCEYKLILKHEKRHLQALYDYHDKHTSKYQAYLGRIAREVPVSPVVRTDEDALEVRNYIEEYFAKKFYEQVNKSIEEVSKIQRKIDSPQEYLGVGKKIDRCEEERNAKQNKKVFFNN